VAGLNDEPCPMHGNLSNQSPCFGKAFSFFIHIAFRPCSLSQAEIVRSLKSIA